MKPPSCERIAREHSPALYQQYLNEGLTAFREEYISGSSGQTLVKEGYVEFIVLPNGKRIAKYHITKVLTVEEAEANE